MTDCIGRHLEFPGLKLENRKVEMTFTGEEVSSNGGVLLVRQADDRIGLSRTIARGMQPDLRDQCKVRHSHHNMLAQRVYAIAAGEEDLNDHDRLRLDGAMKTSVGKLADLASSPTLCRFENAVTPRDCWWINEVFVTKFIESFGEQEPEEIILDFDATDDRVHGQQEGRFFHGYYGDWCFLPLYVFCGEQLLVALLRPSNIDASRWAAAVLKLLVRRLRRVWPGTHIIFRGDSGFCRRKILHFCEKTPGVDYIVGLARNSRLEELAKPLKDNAKAQHQESGQKARIFAEFAYATGTWREERRVIVKAEHTDKGANPRFIVTSLPGDPQELYDKVYCARGEMENRIKEMQLGLFSDRTSATAWFANQWRMLLSASAYVLLETIRRLGLQGTELARAQVGTIRLKLIKIGAVVLKNTRRITFLAPKSYPHFALFQTAAQRLMAPAPTPATNSG